MSPSTTSVPPLLVLPSSSFPTFFVTLLTLCFSLPSVSSPTLFTCPFRLHLPYISPPCFIPLSLSLPLYLHIPFVSPFPLCPPFLLSLFPFSPRPFAFLSFSSVFTLFSLSLFCLWHFCFTIFFFLATPSPPHTSFPFFVLFSFPCFVMRLDPCMLWDFSCNLIECWCKCCIFSGLHFYLSCFNWSVFSRLFLFCLPALSKLLFDSCVFSPLLFSWSKLHTSHIFFSVLFRQNICFTELGEWKLGRRMGVSIEREG